MTTPPLSFLHLPLSPRSTLPDAIKPRLLGTISFSPQSTATEDPILHAAMPGENEIVEVWLGGDGIAAGTQDGVRFRHDSERLFGTIDLPEMPSASDIPPLQSTTEAAYRRIFRLLDALGYSYIYRFWNYISDINGISHGLERYRQFNLGRQEAFLAHGREIKGALPAACALGLAEGPLKIAFLAGRTPAMAIENPRQISAYDYPEEYGPRSPTFSRACLLPEAGRLFISGTASIVGHKTMHAGDVAAQTRETLANLQAVIDEANRRLGHIAFKPGDIAYRVYLRSLADRPVVETEMKRALGGRVHALFVQADICRADLLLEIEATADSAPGS